MSDRLKHYFENKQGVGILSSSDNEGKVNAAVYARPHVFEDNAIGFIMTNRLTHHNLELNPFAHYLFKEEGPGYQGLRLHLKKIKEVQDDEVINPLRRRHYSPEQEQKMKPLNLVYFEVQQELPLIGSGNGDDDFSIS